MPAQAGITVQAWGGVRGDGVDLFTLTNAKGMEARITNYGAIITAIRMPGRDGKPVNVVQGFDSLGEYTSPDYKGRYGAIIGRFANRIMDNTFKINTATYRISRDAYVLNDDKNNRPYDERVWSADTKDGAEPQLILSLIDRNIATMLRLREETARRRTLQAQLADIITWFSGRMAFVYLHVVWFGAWILINEGLLPPLRPFDPFPYGLLTMIVSLEAIFLSTFVMISQNRADAKRQVIANQQWMTVQEEDKQNRELLDLSNQILNLTKAIHARTGVHPDAK